MQPRLFSMVELVEALSCAIDLISPRIANHQLRVAYISLQLAAVSDFGTPVRQDLLLAALLHDCGALSLGERKAIIDFDFDLDPATANRHARAGARLLEKFPPYGNLARIVRHHHLPWAEGRGEQENGEPVPIESHIIHLADRIAVLADPEREILGQVRMIARRIEGHKDTLFAPPLVKAFGDLAVRESFWFDIVTLEHNESLTRHFRFDCRRLDADELLDLALLCAHVIDFRSRFTATHSSGVAATAAALGGLAGMDDDAQRNLRIAGYLHDIGKLGVPAELLEKRSGLTSAETNLMKCHSYFTFKILSRIGNLEEITRLAACHHERLNGRGYPFHYQADALSPGARILAVADVFTALTEDRPYRAGMNLGQAVQSIERMAAHGSLDREATAVLAAHAGEIDRLRQQTQSEAGQAYQRFESSR